MYAKSNQLHLIFNFNTILALPKIHHVEASIMYLSAIPDLNRYVLSDSGFWSKIEVLPL